MLAANRRHRIQRLGSLLVFLASAGILPAQPASPVEASAAVNGVELFYRVYGNGSPLVLLHGFFGTGALWDPWIPELAERYRVIVPDLRGHGRSSNPSGRFTHRESATDILALLDEIGVDRFRAIGASSGAMTLIHIATRQPDRVAGLVLLGGTPYFPETARAIQRSSSLGSIPPKMMRQLEDWHPGGEAQIKALSEQFHSFGDNYEDMSFTSPYLSTILAPTLIIHGDRDEHFPVEIAVEMYRSIPHSYLWVVPKGNHSLISDEWDGSFPGEEMFVDVTLDFLNGKWSTDP